MRTVLYVGSLLAGVWALRYIMTMLYFAAITHVGVLKSLPISFVAGLGFLVTYLPFSLVVARVFIWWKRGKLAAPESFSRFPFAVAVIGVGSVVLAVLTYAVLALSASSGGGLSGVPFGILLVLCGFVLAVLMPVVEVRDWLRFRFERRMARAHV